MSRSAGDLDARTSPAVRAILDLEDNSPDSLLEILPGATVPFWAQVRVQIAWALSAEQTGSVEVAHASTWTRWEEARRVARGYLPSRWDAVRRASRHDVLFYVSGVTLSAEGERARNWLVDDFAEATDQAVVVQHRPLPSPVGRPLYVPTSSMEAATARSRWRARGKPFIPGFVQGMNELLDEFARLLDRPPQAFRAIGNGVLRAERTRHYQLDEVRRMIDRISPKVVFFDNGSYSYNGEQLGLMKDSGAYVVEPQHGWIGPSHPAYNFGRVFDNPALARALPDEVITFGDFWSESIRHPGQVTTIGKPHLERRAAAASPTRPMRILVVSSRTEPAHTDAFVVGLRAALSNDWVIAFRPHPGERVETLDRYPRLSADPGVEIDTAPDVYESLANSRVVVGEASTVLFEARAFGCVVIARESAFAQNVIGDSFGKMVDGVEEAAARVNSLDPHMKAGEHPEARIWAPESIERYRRWLAARMLAKEAR